MSVLNGKRSYIAGPIEFDASGVNWRTEPKNVLRNHFQIDLIDPFEDPKQQWTEQIAKAKKDQDLDTIVKISKAFVRKDLNLVDRSDFIIAYVPPIRTVGTIHEIINSNNAKKPTLLVTGTGNITDVPVWFFGFISTEFMFGTWDDLYNYLDEVNDGKHQDNDRWAYVYGLI